MTDIIFSFDVEDYVNPVGADGILRSAELLRKAGVKGCFNIVAHLAEALVEWGRTDVIDALKYHEIDLHSLAHSYHPTINEYTDIADFETAKEEFFSRELPARETISQIFGTECYPAACPPGNSVSYVAHYGYAQMGVPIYTGDLLIDPVRGRHITSCNITCLDYHLCLDRFLIDNTKEQIDAYIEHMAAEKDMHVLYHHPQMAILDEFWDLVNFYGKNTPREEWRPSLQLPPEKTALFYENLAYLVEKLQNDPRFRILTYAEFAERYCAQERVLTATQLPNIKAQLDNYWFPVTAPDSYCLADIFLACRDLLPGQEAHSCHEVYGFLEAPYAISEAITVTAKELRASVHTIRDDFLPARILVGQQEIGPADWLRAALEVLCGAQSVTLTPADWQIDMDQFPGIRDLDMKGSWVHSADFEDRYLSDRFRLQSWTYRLPPHTSRTIF